MRRRNRLGSWLNADGLTKSLLKLNNTVNEREQRVITPCSHVITGVVSATALTNEDISRSNNFATKLLHSETLSLAVSSVPGTSYRFLMCHRTTSRLQDL
jgi:hypothetical protein